MFHQISSVALGTLNTLLIRKILVPIGPMSTAQPGNAHHATEGVGLPRTRPQKPSRRQGRKESSEDQGQNQSENEILQKKYPNRKKSLSQLKNNDSVMIQNNKYTYLSIIHVTTYVKTDIFSIQMVPWALAAWPSRMGSSGCLNCLASRFASRLCKSLQIFYVRRTNISVAS